MRKYKPKYKAGDILKEYQHDCIYRILRYQRDSLDTGRGWYMVEIVQGNYKDMSEGDRDEFAAELVDKEDSLAVGYLAGKQFDNDLKELLGENNE